MALAACVILVVGLGAAADVSQTLRLPFQQGQPADPEKSASQVVLRPASATLSAPDNHLQPPAQSTAPRSAYLTEEARMAIIRSLSGEFGRAQAALPGGKEGIHIAAGSARGPLIDASKAVQPTADSPKLMVVSAAPAIRPGDRVQITQIQFQSHSIVFLLNGGGYKPFRLWEHLHLELGGPISGGGSVDQPGQPIAYVAGQGSTLYLDFDRTLPDLTPAEIRQALSPFLDFMGSRSPALQYAQSLPPEFQQAIKERLAVVGMDREMVLAAMGRPDRKVRERDDDGNETEDWIYGTPPDKTVFVTFQGDKVVRVRQFH